MTLEYSYLVPENVHIEVIDIYLGTQNVTDKFDVRIDSVNNKFFISKDNADYGHYKVLITYTNGNNTDTYLNNFFVTYGLIGEGIEFDNDKFSKLYKTSIENFYCWK